MQMLSIKMPEKGETVSVSRYDSEGHVTSDTKTNEYSINLKDKAVTHQFQEILLEIL